MEKVLLSQYLLKFTFNRNKVQMMYERTIKRTQWIVYKTIELFPSIFNEKGIKYCKVPAFSIYMLMFDKNFFKVFDLPIYILRKKIKNLKVLSLPFHILKKSKHFKVLTFSLYILKDSIFFMCLLSAFFYVLKKIKKEFVCTYFWLEIFMIFNNIFIKTNIF